MLQKLEIMHSLHSDPQMPVDLSLFPMVNEFTPMSKPHAVNFNNTQSIHFMASQIADMPHLQSLNLLHLDVHAVILIATEKAINHKIQKQFLEYQFISTLSPFHNLRFLHIDIKDEHATATDSQMKALTQTLHHLVGLTLIDRPSPFGEQLLTAIGHQLEYLAVNLAVNYLYEYDIGKLEFKNLKQFRMFASCSVATINQIVSTALNLEKVEMQFSEDNEDIDERFFFINKMLGEYKKLEYLEIMYGPFAEEVLDVIQRGLTRGREHEKKELKIKIYEPDRDAEWIRFMYSVEYEMELITKRVSIINLLACSKVEQWMVLFGGTNMIQELNESVHCAVGFPVQISDDQESNLTVITNDDCTINGYSARWLM